MQRLAPRDTARQPARSVNKTLTVCVVDTRPEDYQQWSDSAAILGIHVRIAASAAEALQFARNNIVDLWVVNTMLSGLSGYDLCGMLRNRSSNHAAICLVADEYSAEAERAAWAAQPTMFGCKGQVHVWFAQWLEHRQRRPSTLVNS